MVNITIYTKNIKEIKNENDLLDYLTIGDNIVKSNRDKDYFVNWSNAIEYLKKYSEEIALLNSILDHDDKPLKLREIIDKYKSINRINEVIPILVAVSEGTIDFQLGDENLNTKKYDFSTTDECMEFLEITGFSKFLNTFKSLRDYIFGIKVGMDTNGRKNRSGTFNEIIIGDILEEKITDKNINIHYQKSFGNILDEERLTYLPSGYSKKKCDFLIQKGHKIINIEVNHFGGGGSKQEIADAYRKRSEDLRQAGIGFVWNTDGSGWFKINKEENKLLQSIRDIDFVTNIKMLKQSDLLNDILNYYFSIN